ncbi:MAG: hypothetical protein ACW99U_14855 [Candidatus Thorarchaeota archaeon]|jgi:hypothetical protein
MNPRLEHSVRVVVEGLHRSYFFRTIDELRSLDLEKTANRVREISAPEDTMERDDLFNASRRFFLAEAIHEETEIESLMTVPHLIGLSPSLGKTKDSSVVEMARDSVIAQLWVKALPRVLIGISVLPNEYADQGVDLFIRGLLTSQESRDQLAHDIQRELDKRAVLTVHFSPEQLLKGYNLEKKEQGDWLTQYIALTLVKASSLPVDTGRLGALERTALVDETVAYVYAMHALGVLRQRIEGYGPRKPFDWPSTGDRTSISQLLETLNEISTFVKNLTSCPLFYTEIGGEPIPMGDVEYVSFLVEEIRSHYEGVLKTRIGMGKNVELAAFVEMMKLRRGEVSRRTNVAIDKAEVLRRELSKLRLEARGGEVQRETPEEIYQGCLKRIEKKIAAKERISFEDGTMVEYMRPLFEALVEVVSTSSIALGEDRDQYTETLCFETCFNVLEYLNLSDYLLDLPWVARFVGEEAARVYDLLGISEDERRKHRTERIAASYMGGLVYLIQQEQTG